jgi:hypothetical protein
MILNTKMTKGGKMKIPEYVTKEEVKRVCRELNIRDWTQLAKPEVAPDEAEIILEHTNVKHMFVDPDSFLRGLEVELEHGTMFEDANVTNNHPLLTGKIVLAHLKESDDYYERLEVAEIEGDMLKALINNDPEKLIKKYRSLLDAKNILAQEILKHLKRGKS